MKKSVKFFAVILAVLIMAVGFSACKGDNAGTGSNGGSVEVVKYINIKLTDEKYAYAVNPNNAELLTAANQLLEEIKSNGKFDAILAKYFEGKGDPTGFEAGTVNKDKDQLIVATNTPFSPFEYKEGNKFYGVDIEIAALLAAKLNKELVIIDMDFDAILNAVNAGTADIGMAGLTVSPDREKLVKFTTAYYDASQVIITKASDTTFDNCKTAADVEAIINAKDKNTVVGVQTGTTGQLYVEGDADWGFAGFPVTCTGYESAASAVTDMLNGSVAFVVVDEAPATQIVKAING